MFDQMSWNHGPVKFIKLTITNAPREVSPALGTLQVKKKNKGKSWMVFQRVIMISLCYTTTIFENKDCTVPQALSNLLGIFMVAAGLGNGDGKRVILSAIALSLLNATASFFIKLSSGC